MSSAGPLVVCVLDAVRITSKLDHVKVFSSRLLKNAPRTLADPLCGSLCDLCVSVVSVFVRIFTTETQRTTEKSLPSSCRLLFQQPARTTSFDVGYSSSLRPSPFRIRRVTS